MRKGMGIMAKIKKVLTFFIFAFITAAAMTAGVIMQTSDGGFASAEADENIIVFNAETDFVITEGTLTGLSESAVNSINTGTYTGYSIEIPSGVVSIAANANFESKIDKLVSLKIPNTVTSIGDRAFYNCQNLATDKIVFENDGAEDLSIGAESFSAPINTGSKFTLHLPDRLNSLGDGAFNRGDLGYVYLPTDVIYATGGGTFFNSDAILIFADVAAYEKNFIKTELSAHAANMTYPVKITFQPGVGSSIEETHFYNKSYNHFVDDNGDCTYVSDAAFPLQDGYSVSVWYDTLSYSSASAKPLTIAGLNAKLKDKSLLETSFYNIELYAKYIDRYIYNDDINDPGLPILKLKDLKFDGKTEFAIDKVSTLFELNDADGYFNTYTGNIDDDYYISLCYMNGHTVTSIKDAGDYILQVNVKNPARFGEWENPLEFDLSVEKTVIDLSVYDNLHWQVQEYSGELLDATLFDYVYNLEDKALELYHYYSLSGLDTPPNPDWINFKLNDTLVVSRSVVYYRDKGYTLGITSAFSDVFKISNISGNNKTEPGKYRARIVLQPGDNYRFVLPEGATSTTLPSRSMNITITKTGDGNGYPAGYAIIEKDWYIVNNDKAVLNEQNSIDLQKEVEFTIPSWQFGDDVYIPRPRLQHGDFNYTYDISLNGENIDRNVPSADWGKYINKFMPAGKYTVTINAAAVHVGTHTHWWNGVEHGSVGDSNFDYAAFSMPYDFRVSEGVLRIRDNDRVGTHIPSPINIANLKNRQNAEFFAYIEGGSLGGIWQGDRYLNGTYYNRAGVDLSVNGNSNDIVGKIQEIKQGLAGTYWIERFDEYYEETPTYKYNLARMYNVEYFTADDAKWDEYITTPGEYRVYYVASLKNFASDPVLSNDRYEKYYTLTLYSEVQAPQLNRTDYIYTGLDITVQYTADVLTDELLYLISGNVNTEAGTYNATFTLADKTHYRWVQSGNKFDADGNLVIPYVINPAEVQIPVLPGMNYVGQEIVASTNIELDLNGRPVYTVKDLGTNDNVNIVENRIIMTYTEVGEYSIELVLNDTRNYVWAGNSSADGVAVMYLNIIKGNNSWLSEIDVIPWEWHEFNAAKNLITARVREGNILFRITDLSGRVLSGLDDFTLDSQGRVTEDVAEALNELPVGSYNLCGRVDETNNYFALGEDSYRFEIQPANNVWLNSPNVIRWRWREFDPDYNLFSAEAKYGDVTFSVIKDGKPVEGLRNFSSHRDVAEKLNALDAGLYGFIAHVREDVNGNYNELTTSFSFNVMQATNYWVSTPNIIRWVLYRYDEEVNKITAEPRYGGIVTFGILKDGEPVEGLESFTTAEATTPAVTELLKDLGGGSYELTARVNGNDNFTGLDSTVKFTVLLPDNYWLQVPNIIRWTWQEFDPDYNVISAVPAFGDEGDVKFSILKDGLTVSGLYRFSTVDQYVSAALNSLDVGEYVLRSELAETETAAELIMDVTFNVMRATNVWIQTPNIARWIAGEEHPSQPTGQSKYGIPEFRIYTTTEAGGFGETVYDSKENIDLLEEIGAGWYKLVVKVEDAENYTGLNSTELSFRVFASEQMLMTAVKTNALESYRLYASLNDETCVSDLIEAINNGTTADEVNAALAAARADVDLKVFKREKAKAISELAQYESRYDTPAAENLKKNLEAAADVTELNSALVAAKADIDYRSAIALQSKALEEIEGLEQLYSLTCPENYKKIISESYSYDVIAETLAQAKSEMDARLSELNAAKSHAVAEVKAYLEGKGVKYDSDFVKEIMASGSVEEVEAALERAFAAAPAGNSGAVVALGIVVAIFGLIALGAGGFILYYFVLRKKLKPAGYVGAPAAPVVNPVTENNELTESVIPEDTQESEVPSDDDNQE